MASSSTDKTSITITLDNSPVPDGPAGVGKGEQTEHSGAKCKARGGPEGRLDSGTILQPFMQDGCFKIPCVHDQMKQKLKQVSRQVSPESDLESCFVSVLMV